MYLDVSSLPESWTIILNILKTLDNGKTALSVKRLNEHLYTLEVDFDDNSNIGKESLDKKCLHLNPRGSDKLAINFNKKMIWRWQFSRWSFYLWGKWRNSESSEIRKSVLSEASNFQNCESWKIWFK